MLKVRLKQSGRGSLKWLHDDACLPSVSQVSQRDFDRRQPIDLTTQPSFRLNVSNRKCDESTDRSVIAFQFHHAAFDGVGAWRQSAIG